MKGQLVGLSFPEASNFPSELHPWDRRLQQKQWVPELEDFFQAFSAGHGMVVPRVELVDAVSFIGQSLLF